MIAAACRVTLLAVAAVRAAPAGAEVRGPIAIVPPGSGVLRVSGAALAALPDPGGGLTISDVTSPSRAATFGPAPDGPTCQRSPVWWVRVDVRDASSVGRHLLLTPGRYWDRADLFVPDGPEAFRRSRSGRLVPVAERSERDGELLFRFLSTPNEPFVGWLRLESDMRGYEPPRELALEIRDAEIHAARAKRFLWAQGLYAGVILAMALYNVFLFVSFRDRSYLYYVVYIACFGALWFAAYGPAFELVWPDAAVWNKLSTFYLTAASALTGTLFARNFLRSKEFVPRLDRVFVAGMAGVVVAVAASAVGLWSVAENLLAFAALVLTLVYAPAGLACLRLGYRPARFLVLAWATLLFGTTIYILAFFGVLPWNDFTRYTIQVGSALDVILLSLALADRINTMRRATDSAERAYRRRLEKEVSARTQELEAERTRAEDARRAAEAGSRAKSAFVANMSHELRTPLNAILGYGEMLVEEAGARGHADLVPDLKRITASGQHLLGLINDVLDLSKIESGRVGLDLVETDARSLLEDALTTARPIAMRNGNVLEADLASDLGVVTTDPKRLRQILLNLLANAAKFTESGTLRLSARRSPSDAGDVLVVRVSDTGIGISPQEMERIFQPFTQGDPSTTRRYGGTGLGLYISRRFARMMGGEIAAESEKGKGSTFTLRVPCRATAVPISGEHTALPAANA